MPSKGYRSLTLRIAGERITHDRFLRAVESFFGLLKELTAEIAGAGSAIDWVVTVKRGSINLGVAGEERKPSVPVTQVVNAVYRGLKQLQTTRTRPAHFTDDALQDARDLARLVDGKAVRVIQIQRSRERFRVQDKAIANVDAILGGVIKEVGSIEGRLEMISSRGTLHFGVWDALDGRHIRCFVKPQMIDEVKRAFDKRVAISGTIRYRPTGEPVSIEVEEIEIFPSEETLPTAEEVYGILSEVG